MLRRFSLTAGSSVVLGAPSVRHALRGYKDWGDVSSDLTRIHEAFAESRELISDARESIGTTYFADDLADAKESTENVLAQYDVLRAAVEKKGTPELFSKLTKEYDIKFKQLRAELDGVLHHDE